MKVNKFKFLGVMFFITILMDVVPYFGFMKIGSISITNMHIPVILTSIVLGPLEGALVGAVFGIISLARAVSRESTVLDMLLKNPFISVLPRICLPLVSGFFYKLIRKILPPKYEIVQVAATSVVGAATNCILVMMSLYLIYPKKLMTIFGLSDHSQILMMLVKALGPNVIVEALTCALVCIFIVTALKKHSHSREPS